MAAQPKKLFKTVAFVAKRLSGTKYAFRGTTSLVLQKIEMNVDDIDLIADKETALATNTIFSDFLKTRVEFKETDQYKSYFGSFIVDDLLVEVMGNWQIKNHQGVWSRVYDAAADQIAEVKLPSGKTVVATTVETELEMFSAMGRWSAYHKIKKQYHQKNQQAMF